MNRVLAPIVLLCLAAGLLFGASTITKTAQVSIDRPAQIKTVTLKPGTYQVELLVAGQNAQTAEVKWMHDGKQVADVTGQVKQLKQKPERTDWVIDTSTGTRRVAEVDFSGTNTGVVF